MKRYVSVFEMIIRSSIYKVIGIFAIMAVGEIILLTLAWNQPIATLQPSMEEWVENSRDGYGPEGKQYIAHVDIPESVENAFSELKNVYGNQIREANPLYAKERG